MSHIREERVGGTHPLKREEHVGGTHPKKEKMDHYMLCLSYPQAQEGQINSLHILLIMGQGI